MKKINFKRYEEIREVLQKRRIYCLSIDVKYLIYGKIVIRAGSRLHDITLKQLPEW